MLSCRGIDALLHMCNSTSNMDYKGWTAYKSKLLKDPAVKAEYDRLAPQYDLISQIIKARIEKQLTQAQLAQRIGTGQSAISRFESGNYNPSLEFLHKVAVGIGKELVVSFK